MKIKFLLCTYVMFLANFISSQTKSSATLRLEEYKSSENCDVTIPSENQDWNIEFETSNLLGDLAPNDYYTRRDPSSVLKINGKYYVWYSYSITNGSGKISPWDLNDLYYATSEDGYTWKEEGIAIARGEEGSYDHRSAFTTEVFYYDKMFYLVYQASDTQNNLNSGNTIAMAHANNPNGPWTKLSEPILHPSKEKSVAFDKFAVHDPCIIRFKDKFYMYYKGEGNETPICSYNTQIWGTSNKQVKWGVAIADDIKGPYIKSEFNPITNTGHEVTVWKSGEGIGIMLHQDGPEYGTTQYASDGLNFNIMGKVDFPLKQPWSSTYPEAAGLYRPVTEEKSPVTGVSWGLSHVLNWGGTYGSWMYLKRFENKNKAAIVDDKNNQGIIIDSSLLIDKYKSKDVKHYPNPVLENLKIKGFKKGGLSIYDIKGVKLFKEEIDYDNSEVNLSHLSPGLYILKLIGSSINYTSQILKK